MSEPRGILYILTLPNKFFGRSNFGWKSIDLAAFQRKLSSRRVESCVLDLDRVLGMAFQPQDSLLVASIEDHVLDRYVKEVLYILRDRVNLIPNLNCVMCYENKGFQELLKSAWGFGNLAGTYIYSRDQLPQDYPYVFKTITGAGSSGVSLVRGKSDRQRLIRRKFMPSLRRRVITFLRRFKLSPEETKMYEFRHQGFCLGVVQKFVPGLEADFKVLVFSKKLYVLRRRVRRGDFRASGSGAFEFVDPPPEVLDYAQRVAVKLCVPYVSLDIAVSASGVHLLEFQCINFGPYTLNFSPAYYSRIDDTWVRFEATPVLEVEMAEAVADFLETHS